MVVCHLGREIECNSKEELESALMIRFDGKHNHFWIAGNERYPCLEVLVNGELSSLIYYPEESCCMQSIGGTLGLNIEENTLFCQGFVTELCEIANEFVIPFSKALEATKEFYLANCQKPSDINWYEF